MSKQYYQSFKEYLYEKELPIQVQSYVLFEAIIEYMDTQLNESSRDELQTLLNEGLIDKFLDKIGIEVEKTEGLIHYFAKFTKGVGKAIYCAILKDKQCVQDVIDQFSKEQFIDFLMKLDLATLHMITGPLHFIAATTGIELNPILKKAEDVPVIDKIKQSIKFIKDKAKTIVDKALAPIVVKKAEELEKVVVPVINK